MGRAAGVPLSVGAQSPGAVSLAPGFRGRCRRPDATRARPARHGTGTPPIRFVHTPEETLSFRRLRPRLGVTCRDRCNSTELPTLCRAPTSCKAASELRCPSGCSSTTGELQHFKTPFLTPLLWGNQFNPLGPVPIPSRPPGADDRRRMTTRARASTAPPRLHRIPPVSLRAPRPAVGYSLARRERYASSSWAKCRVRTAETS